MGSDMKWEDTSHRAGQSFDPPEPTCWTLRIPVLEFRDIVVVVHRTQKEPNIWHLSCQSIVLGPHQLWNSKIEGAKVEALQHLHMVIGQMATSIGDVAMDWKPENYSKQEEAAHRQMDELNKLHLPTCTNIHDSWECDPKCSVVALIQDVIALEARRRLTKDSDEDETLQEEADRETDCIP